MLTNTSFKKMGLESELKIWILMQFFLGLWGWNLFSYTPTLQKRHGCGSTGISK